MTPQPASPADQDLAVSIHLLDSSKGHPVRTWSFHDRPVVNIGRLEDNDVVVTDPAVSRLHAVLQFDRGEWELKSVGKHGVLMNDERIESIRLCSQNVFRLGPNGPTLRFESRAAAPAANQQCTSTIEFGSVSIRDLGFNQDLAVQEVSQITGDEKFQDLLAQAAALRKRRTETSG